MTTLPGRHLALVEEPVRFPLIVRMAATAIADLGGSLPLPALAEVSLSDLSSPILVSSPSRRRRRHAVVSAVVVDRSRAQAAPKSGSLWIQAGASFDLANMERRAASCHSCCPACLAALSSADTMARDEGDCRRYHYRGSRGCGRVAWRSGAVLSAPVAVGWRCQPVDPGV